MAASGTMILLDPDLDPDQSPNVKLKRSAPPTPRMHSRSNRIPSVRILARFLQDVQSVLRLRGRVTVLLTTDKTVRRLNRQYRGKNKTTDVLSFPAADPLKSGTAGDVAISVHTARKQAADQGHTLATELKVLMLHGLLHLAGYDHEVDSGEMARREQRLRAKLRLPQGLIERSRKGVQA